MTPRYLNASGVRRYPTVEISNNRSAETSERQEVCFVPRGINESTLKWIKIRRERNPFGFIPLPLVNTQIFGRKHHFLLRSEDGNLIYGLKAIQSKIGFRKKFFFFAILWYWQYFVIVFRKFSLNEGAN